MLFGYGKMTRNALAAMSLLAQTFDGGRTRHSAAEIAQKRHLQRPIVAKLLGILAQAGLVTGSPGPGGGYTLTRPPAQISLFEVVTLFERTELDACPYGPGHCGSGSPCPLHDSLAELHARMTRFLSDTKLDIFTQWQPGDPLPAGV